MESSKTQIITIYSPKGGTGKTTFSVHLAIEFARRKRRVLLLDIAQFGNVGTVLKLNLKGGGLTSVLSYFEFADEGIMLEQAKVIKENIQKFEELSCFFDVLIAAAPSKMEELDAVKMKKILQVLVNLSYDIIIVDTSSEISQRNLCTMLDSEIVLLLTEQDISCIWNIISFKDIMQYTGSHEKIKLILMKETKYSGMAQNEIEEATGYKIIFKLPEDKAIRFYNNQKVGLARRREKYGRKIKKFASTLIKSWDKKDGDVV